MTNNKISGYQFMCIVVLFLFGSSVLVPPATAGKQDVWFVLILTSLWSIGLFYIYLSLSKIFPDDTIVEYLPKVFGNLLGKFIAAFYVFFFILLCALVIRNIVDFMTTLMTETPMIAISIPILMTSSYLLTKDLAVISKIVELFFPLAISIYIFATIALMPYADINNLRPFISDNFISNVLHGFIQGSGWPFGEIITLTMIIPYLKTKKVLSSGAIQGVLIMCFLFVTISLRNRAVLGNAISFVTYPSLSTIDVVQLPGLGGIVYLIFIAQTTNLFTKVTICYYAGAKGFSQLIGSKNYKVFIFPLLVILVYLSLLAYENITDTVTFGLNIYPYYLFSLSFLLPFTAYIIARFKFRKGQ